jgi:hypothetical protein
MPFGKYKNRLLTDIPPSYLEWCLNNIADLSPYLRREMEQLVGVQPQRPATSVDVDSIRAGLREVIKRWYRHASMRHHPDHGGSNERQRVVNECYQELADGVERLSLTVRSSQ